jgi:hypothetical protein
MAMYKRGNAMTAIKRPKTVHQMTSAQFDTMFPVCDEDVCRAYLVTRLWPNGVICTFHNVSKKYLHLYVAEFQFRYNNRFNDDIFGTAIEGC